MYVSTNDFVDLVRNRNQAQQVIAELLARFSSETAQARIEEEARFAKQTTEEVVNRTATNLLASFVARKPGGYVEDVR